MTRRAPLSESAWQRTVVEAASAHGWHHYHTHDSRRSPAGFPDLVLCNPLQERVWFVELKTDAGKLGAQQADWLGWLRRSGMDADVWRPRDWLAVARILNGSQLAPVTENFLENFSQTP